MGDKVEFIATFPPIMSAIKVTGNDDGMRIQLDIPESELGNAARLLLMRKEVLKVTIEVEDQPEKKKKRY
jgi:hypothetical protein